jgi:hypothetical protein
MTTRRRFVQILPVAGAAAWMAACSDKAAPPAPAATPAPARAPAAAPAPAAPATTAPVDEKEPLAVSLGYVADAARADTAKYKTYAAGQTCGNCALFTGKPGDVTGPCPVFAGRHVSSTGWCGSYAKKV